MTIDPRTIAAALKGTVTSRLTVLAPGPNHSRADRSLSIKIDPAAQDGFLVHSFAEDSPIICREYVRDALGIGTNWQSSGRRSLIGAGAPIDESSRNSTFALRLWNEAVDPRGTVVDQYLASRSLILSAGHQGDAIRFHPALKLNGKSVCAMIALFRDIRTNEPCGIHRTFLDAGGQKVARKMLGRVRNAAIKLDADEDVSLGLHIGEGVESCIAAGLSGFRPVWALGSASAISKFPVLCGIEAITVLGETSDNGANHRAAHACAARWIEGGRKALIAEPQVGCDLNDLWSEVVA